MKNLIPLKGVKQETTEWSVNKTTLYDIISKEVFRCYSIYRSLPKASSLKSKTLHNTKKSTISSWKLHILVQSQSLSKKIFVVIRDTSIPACFTFNILKLENNEIRKLWMLIFSILSTFLSPHAKIKLRELGEDQYN